MTKNIKINMMRYVKLHLKITLQKWRKIGDHILVIPPNYHTVQDNIILIEQIEKMI